jgi:hypothetical protein
MLFAGAGLLVLAGFRWAIWLAPAALLPFAAVAFSLLRERRD